MKPIFAIFGTILTATAGIFASPQASDVDTEKDTVIIDVLDPGTAETDTIGFPTKVTDFFLFSNSGNFDKIDHSAKLDMLDYYYAGKKEKMPTRLGGTAYIDSLTARYMKIITSESAFYEIAMFGKGDNTTFAVIKTIQLPAEDSQIDFYSTKDGATAISLPGIEDFLSKEGKKQMAELRRRIPFPLMKISVADESSLEVRISVCDYLSAEDSAFVAPLLGRNRIVYEWKKNKFREKK